MNCFKWRIYSKKLIVCVLALALILGSGFTSFIAYADNATNEQGTGFSDVEGHWAKDQVLDWSEKGLVSGYDDGTFKPERGVTRAEFITFVNRAYGLTAKAQLDFSDVSPQDWFADEVAKAVAAGYISGYDDGTMRPAAEISRLEAAVILYKLLRLASLENESWIDGFNDSGSIASWGREYVNSVVAEGYFSGYPDGTFKPDRVITRAETVALLSKAVGTLYNAPGTYGPEEGSQTVAGNVTVSVSDVTLQNLVIEGDLFLTAGIGDGDFEADGIVVKGRTIVSGGGEDSVVFNNSSLEEVIVYVVDGKVRIVARGDTYIDNVVLESGGYLQEEDLTGDGFGDVQVLVLNPGESIELEGDFDWVIIETVVEVSITGDTRIGELEVSGGAEGTKIDTERGTVIETLTLDSATDVTGQGTIKTAYVNTDDYSFDKEPDEVIVDGKKVEEEKKSSGGGGGGGVEEKQVSAISVKTEVDGEVVTDLSGLDNDAVVTVTLTTTTSGATIYYTKDGTTPTSSSTKYTEPFTVEAPGDEGGPVIVKAIGMRSGYTNSAVATKTI
ncbi:MAG: S-layer homology domain-containing protein, partial [Bacillota bacterium]